MPGWCGPGARAGTRAVARCGGAALARTHSVGRDERHLHLVCVHALCVSCGRCVRTCGEVPGAFARTATGRGCEADVQT